MPKRTLPSQLPVPNVLIIPDGNRRWAREHGVDYEMAYEQAADRMHAITQYLGNLGAQEVWFSITRPFNLNRASAELDAIHHATTRVYEIGQEKSAPINISADGDLTGMSPTDVACLSQQMAASQPNHPVLHMLFNWAADTEVADLFQQGQKNPDAPSDLENLRQMSAIKQPIDLIIRTGLTRPGHIGRLSSVAPWHSLDAELAFPPMMFPDYTPLHLAADLADYQNAEHKNQTAVPDHHDSTTPSQN